MNKKDFKIEVGQLPEEWKDELTEGIDILCTVSNNGVMFDGDFLDNYPILRSIGLEDFGEGSMSFSGNLSKEELAKKLNGI